MDKLPLINKTKGGIVLKEIMEEVSIESELKIQTDNKKAAEELEKRDFQVRNIVIQELSEMTSEDFEGKAGKKAFEDSIRSQINPLMQKGEVTEVYIVSYVIQ